LRNKTSGLPDSVWQYVTVRFPWLGHRQGIDPVRKKSKQAAGKIALG
jgi:hypothetical protein